MVRVIHWNNSFLTVQLEGDLGSHVTRLKILYSRSTVSVKLSDENETSIHNYEPMKVIAEEISPSLTGTIMKMILISLLKIYFKIPWMDALKIPTPYHMQIQKNLHNFGPQSR